MIIKGIDKEKLVLLKFSEEEVIQELKWKHSKEFEYKGEMYDIVETKEVDHIIYYWCWWDHKETQLNQQLTELVKNIFNQNPQKTQKENQLISFYNLLFISNYSAFSSSMQLVKTAHFFYYLAPYYSITLKPLFPPPRS
ncbi:hypothetical protein [uncultured Polaribacter sp.]|uniref:hypothetical protein n=1 Tax=uncultured Polaribacter sp. TaxID=174711 RepID=UPI002623BCD6|nr:hypothetical protein [uncultured Polaribacter sp.]